MLPPETPLITSVASSSVVGRPFQSKRVACISVSTPKPKAAALAPPPESVTATRMVGSRSDLRSGMDWSSGFRGSLIQGRTDEQPASRARAATTAHRRIHGFMRCTGIALLPWLQGCWESSCLCQQPSSAGNAPARVRVHPFDGAVDVFDGREALVQLGIAPRIEVGHPRIGQRAAGV